MMFELVAILSLTFSVLMFCPWVNWMPRNLSWAERELIEYRITDWLAANAILCLAILLLIM